MAGGINPESYFKRASLVCMSVALALGIAAIAGWLLNLYTLAGIRSEYIPMAPSTAIAFIILSSAFFIRTLKPLSNAGRLFSIIVSGFVLFVSSLVIIQFLGGISSDIEKILVRTPAMLGRVPIGRMSPITAISFFLIGTSGLLFHLSSEKKNIEKAAALLAAVQVLAGFIILLGYAYGAPFLYGGRIIPVALTTAVAFVFLGSGVLLSAGSHLWPVNSFRGSSTRARLLRAFLPFIAVSILFEGWLNTVILSGVRTNPALDSAIKAIFFSFFMIVIITNIAKTIGASIDRAEEALRESEQKYRTLADNAIVGIYRSKLEGQFTYVNNAMVRIFECDSAEELLSLPIQIRYKKPQDMKLFIDLLIDKGRAPYYELEILTKTGKIKNIIISATLEGDVISGIVVDITEQKRLEDQLRQAQKMEAVGQLTGGIAHDFNNILTAIMGYAGLMQMKMKEDDPFKVNVDQILASSERAAHLTQGLLAFSRRQVLNPKPVDINNVINTMVKLLKRVIGEDIELETDPSQEPLTIMADSVQVEQALMNFATNARDAMPKGGQLTIETKKIELDEEFIKAHGYGAPGTYALMSISDNGVGMDEKTREKIFEPFFTTKEAGKGTGLGLSMVYGIVKQHNGYINVYSEPSRGTTFKIYLPLIETGQLSEEKPEEHRLPAGGNETILLAEDDEAVRRFTVSVLHEFGYKVIEAVDGEEAITKFMENKDGIRLLILDVIMPRKSGKDAYDEIKAINPGIKVLFASGYTDDVIQSRKFIEEGSFISKPVSPTILLKKIREILDRKP
ncbi:MAG: PAS/PAC sensor hybrid histidine kinase [Nitrospirae bacterium]|nr:MAG: PAS/PAC sensor hybrid histidine kinase [Nitrospirota bacterium]